MIGQSHYFGTFVLTTLSLTTLSVFLVQCLIRSDGPIFVFKNTFSKYQCGGKRGHKCFPICLARNNVADTKFVSETQKCF